MKIIRIAAAALLVLAVAALAGVGRPEAAGGASDEPTHGITITGTGEVRARPDRAVLFVGVQSEGSSAERALAANNAALRRVIDALKAAGVASEDLKTEQHDVSPHYDSEGYTASASLTVRDQPLDRARSLGSVATAAGADTVSGPSLSLADPRVEYRRALARAFDDARARAETLAQAAGVSLGEVTAIVEGQQYDGPVWATAARAAAPETKTPIEPGTEQISASVTVTFAIS